MWFLKYWFKNHSLLINPTSDLSISDELACTVTITSLPGIFKLEFYYSIALQWCGSCLVLGQVIGITPTYSWCFCAIWTKAQTSDGSRRSCTRVLSNASFPTSIWTQTGIPSLTVLGLGSGRMIKAHVYCETCAWIPHIFQIHLFTNKYEKIFWIANRYIIAFSVFSLTSTFSFLWLLMNMAFSFCQTEKPALWKGRHISATALPCASLPFAQSLSVPSLASSTISQNVSSAAVPQC